MKLKPKPTTSKARPRFSLMPRKIKVTRVPPDVLAEAWRYEGERDIHVAVKWRGNSIGVVCVKVPR